MQLFLFSICALSLFYYRRVVRTYISKWPELGHSIIGENQPGVAVIIPARNEEENLPLLLANLRAQNYPNFSVFIVDDHSEDSTSEILKSVDPALFTILKNTGEGKKAALMTALSRAKDYEHFLFTDADCVHGPNWIASMMDAHLKNESDMTVGGVIGVSEADSLAHKYHNLELWAWLSLTGASVAHKLHPMANGANMLLNKSLLTESDPFAADKSSSGDDMFTADRAFNRQSLNFSTHIDSIVRTFGPRDWTSLAMQKRRWASKNHLIENSTFKEMTRQLSYVYIALAMCAVASIFYLWAVGFLVITLFVKNQYDAQLMQKSASDMNVDISWTDVLLNQPMNLLLSWQSAWPKWKWKSRSFKKA